MSFFNDGTLDKFDPNIIIDGVMFPFTYLPVQAKPQLTYDLGRLEDNTAEGYVVGVKHTIELKYEYLNKEHFDLVYGIMQKYEAGNTDAFFDITVPTSTPNEVQTYTVYLGSSSFSSWECIDNTIKKYLDTGDESYNLGGKNYDELHKGIVINFVEK